jgi:hypothetical protein
MSSRLAFDGSISIPKLELVTLKVLLVRQKQTVFLGWLDLPS